MKIKLTILVILLAGVGMSKVFNKTPKSHTTQNIELSPEDSYSEAQIADFHDLAEGTSL